MTEITARQIRIGDDIDGTSNIGVRFGGWVTGTSRVGLTIMVTLQNGIDHPLDHDGVVTLHSEV